MFKFFKKKEEEQEEKKNSLMQGMAYGIGAALIIVVVVLGIIFGPKMFKKDAKTETGANGAVVSNLRVTVITKNDCADCFDINILTDALKQNGAKLKEEKLDMSNKNAQKLIAKYKITKVPTVIISGDLNKNPDLASFWTTLGDVTDGVFVFRQVIPPYIDVASGQLKGKLSLIELSDTSCKECYDVKLHETALKNLGIEPKDTRTVDVSSDEGKQLVSKYKIEKVPTILIKGEVAEYTSLVQMWPTYGKVADDGTYIFTKLDVMGTYKDLIKNKVVEVKPQTEATGTPAIQQ